LPRVRGSVLSERGMDTESPLLRHGLPSLAVVSAGAKIPIVPDEKSATPKRG
jgi:hypothetical protein